MRRLIYVFKDESSQWRFKYLSNDKEKVVLRKLCWKLIFIGISVKEYLLMLELASLNSLSVSERVFVEGIISILNPKGIENWNNKIPPVKNALAEFGIKAKILQKYLQFVGLPDGFLIPSRNSKDLLIFTDVKYFDPKLQRGISGYVKSLSQTGSKRKSSGSSGNSFRKWRVESSLDHLLMDLEIFQKTIEEFNSPSWEPGHTFVYPNSTEETLGKVETDLNLRLLLGMAGRDFGINKKGEIS